MTKQIAFILIIALRLAYNPSKDGQTLNAFANPIVQPKNSLTIVPGFNLNQAGSSERLILKWIIGDNRPASCFQNVKEIYEINTNSKSDLYVKLENSGTSETLVVKNNSII